MGRAIRLNRTTLYFWDQSKTPNRTSQKGSEILIGTPGRIFELIKLKKIKMMSVNTIILDEYDELLSDSQYDFVQRISRYVPRDHQMVYMSATNKVDQTSLEENTLLIDLSEQTNDAIQHFYLMTDKRERTDLLRKFANIPDFRALVFSIVYLIWVLRRNASNIMELLRFP